MTTSKIQMDQIRSTSATVTGENIRAGSQKKSSLSPAEGLQGASPDATCTCPSGDGSLRHPCPAHPASVELAGGDERAAFELFVRKHCGMPEHIAVNWDAKFTNDAWEGWKARAALAQPSQAIAAAPTYQFQSREIGESDWAPCDFRWYLYCSKSPEMDTRVVEVTAQPSPAPTDEKPGDSILCSGCFAKGVGPEHFDEAGKCLARQQTEPLGAEFAQVLSDNLPELLSTAKAEQAEAERPEQPKRHTADVFYHNHFSTVQMEVVRASDFDEFAAQHERIVGALRAENAKLSEALDRWPLIRDILKLRLAAAQARVAELEKQEPAGAPMPDEIHQMAFEEGQPAEDGDGYLFSAEEFDLFVQRLLDSCAAPVAQAQQLHDLDKQCRDDVARALGLRPSQERGFAWSYLLASIKSCVKASEDAAQAQHSVPDGYRLIRLEHFAAIKAQLNPEQVDAYRGRNIYDEDKVYANWNAYRSALDEIKDVFQQIDWDAENELADMLAAAPARGQHSVPEASEQEKEQGWTLDYRFVERVTDLAASRTEYTTSMEATEQVLLAARELLAAAPGKEGV
ncbi:hypothetical protein PCP69_18435 [Pseudomonas aeruginosa]|uniref:hypothetical protein n=1 Tax=Pseudomonas aeruginosa TaxID=287 RepID=UPI002E2D4864|nr:hypothetical protein [Pseudomonas aeruginosa]